MVAKLITIIRVIIVISQKTEIINYHILPKYFFCLPPSLPENLSFQSARCNQHIQTSMNYFETTEYNCKEEVKNRINKLFILHKSKEWTDILEKINSIVK